MARERGRAPLIPDFLWPWIVAVLAVLAAIVATFSILLYDRIGQKPFEREVQDWIDAAGIPRHVFRLGLEFGAPRFFIAIVLLLALWAVVRRSAPALVACAAVPASVLIVEQALKPLVDRTWELPTSAPTYPSGTAAGVAAWTTLTWLLAAPAIRSRALKLALAAALLLVAGLTAVAVVGAHRHFLYDAIGGAAAGTGIVLAWCALIDVSTGAHRPDEVAQLEEAVARE